MANITLREYNPENGSLIGNVNSLKFGKLTSGSTTPVKVFDIVFDGVSNVSNLKIGLISSGGITVNVDPQGVSSVGATNGNFGIKSSAEFDSSMASGDLDRFFAGLNGTGTSTDSNNVSVGMRSDNISNYIYINMRLSSSISGSANGAYKIFFDYS